MTGLFSMDGLFVLKARKNNSFAHQWPQMTSWVVQSIQKQRLPFVSFLRKNLRIERLENLPRRHSVVVLDGYVYAVVYEDMGDCVVADTSRYEYHHGYQPSLS